MDGPYTPSRTPRLFPTRQQPHRTPDANSSSGFFGYGMADRQGHNTPQGNAMNQSATSHPPPFLPFGLESESSKSDRHGKGIGGVLAQGNDRKMQHNSNNSNKGPPSASLNDQFSMPEESYSESQHETGFYNLPGLYEPDARSDTFETNNNNKNTNKNTIFSNPRNAASSVSPGPSGSEATSANIFSKTTTPQAFDSMRSSAMNEFIADSERWITVFGFPPENTTYILRFFRENGEILRYVPGEGNYIHILFATKLQAQQALNKNGKLIDKGLMIGVLPTPDKTLATLSTSNTKTGTPGPVRSLRRHPHALSADWAIDGPASESVPRPNTSWWFKLLQYLIGF